MLRKQWYFGTNDICERLGIAKRTLFEDLRFIRRELGLNVKYDRSQHSYYYDNPKQLKEFDVIDHLASAFSCECEPRTVLEITIQFHADIASKVKEHQWHPEQRFTDKPDGSCLLVVPINNFSCLKKMVLTCDAMGEVIELTSLGE